MSFCEDLAICRNYVEMLEFHSKNHSFGTFLEGIAEEINVYTDKEGHTQWVTILIDKDWENGDYSIYIDSKLQAVICYRYDTEAHYNFNFKHGNRLSLRLDRWAETMAEKANFVKIR